MQSDDALLLFADPQQQDARKARGTVDIAISDMRNARADGAINRQLVRWHQRHTAPGDEGCAEQLHRWRRHTAPGAFAAERGNRTRMRQKKCGLLPDARQQIVEVIGSRWARARADSHRGYRGMQQPMFGVVEDFGFLTLFDSLNREAKLLAQLIVNVVVEISDTGMQPNHGLNCL